MKKAKKFGRGGDVLTGIGAALLGKALYDKYSDKDKESKSKNPSDENEERKKGIAAPKEDKELPKQGKFPEEPKDGTSGAAYEDKPAPAAKKAKPAAKPTVSSTSSTPKARADDLVGREYMGFMKVGKGYEGLGKPKPAAPSTTKPSTAPSGNKPQPPADNDSLPSKPYPSGVKGSEKDPYNRGYGPRNTFLSKENSDQANRAYGQAWRDQNPTISKVLGGMKKGGAVKKMASGGSVSSASKRGDGIAQRGKTRGKVC
jgi:hypothetical protein